MLARSFHLQNEPQDSTAKDGRSALAGLSSYWSDPQKKPSFKWRKWSVLFAVAMTEKYCIAISEVLNTIANEADRNRALFNNLDHSVAEQKCVGLLYLSVGAMAGKTFTDKYPAAKIAEISLNEPMDNCKETFDTKRNRTLDRFRFPENRCNQKRWNNIGIH